MGRDRRLIHPGGIYHAVTKGNNGALIVHDPLDRQYWRLLFDRVASKYEWEVYAWCLLGNHHHVLLSAPQGGFSEGFQLLNGSHARQINRRHGRVGHLVRNRFFSVEISTEAHLVASLLYVPRNPVAAGLCRVAGAWRDSSYRATVGDEPAPRWLALEKILPLFGRTPNRARAVYSAQVAHGHLPVSDTVTEVQSFLNGPPGWRGEATSE